MSARALRRLATAPIREAGVRALTFTDMAGSTQIVRELGDARAHAVLAGHNEIVRSMLLAYEDARSIALATCTGKPFAFRPHDDVELEGFRA